MGRGIIILSIFDWWSHSHGHSDMQLARVLAKSHPVLFVNSIGMRSAKRSLGGSLVKRIGRKLRSMSRIASRPIPELDLVVYTPLFWPAYSGLLGKFNNGGLRSQIQYNARRLGFDRPLVLITLPTFADLALSLDRSALLYNRSDRHADFQYSDHNVVAAKEELLFRKSDAVLYASRSLYEAEIGRATGRSVYIGHGADLDHFCPEGPIAEEFQAIPAPRVGFFGDLREHAIDFPLLESVVRAMPHVQFILGGTQLDDLSALRRLPNIQFFPACPHENMPARWRALDVAILPYKVTPWTQAIEPIKLNEIAATGLPAVGTRLPAFEDRGIAIAETGEEFVQAISRALKRSDPMRAAAGELRRWESIAEQIEEIAADVSPVCTGAP